MTTSPYKLPEGFALKGGEYRIYEFLGSNSYSLIYRIEDQKGNRQLVAREILISGLHTRDEEHILRCKNDGDVNWEICVFLWERRLQALKGVDMLHMAALHDFFIENNTIYIIQEWIRGKNLKEMVERTGKFDEATVMRWGLEVAAALEKLHKVGFAHLNLRPSHVLITEQGTALLTDYGLPQMLFEMDGLVPSIFLDPGYAAIEVYKKVEVNTYPADVYALCALLYFALTATRPVPSPDRIDRPLPTPQKLNVNISNHIAEVILKGMSLKAKDRYADLEELAKAIVWDNPDRRLVRILKEIQNKLQLKTAESYTPTKIPIISTRAAIWVSVIGFILFALFFVIMIFET